MTRKLLVVEVNRSQINMIVVSEAITKLFHDQSIEVRVHELPLAEELGRVALSEARFRRNTSPEKIGQAILDALTRRKEEPRCA